MRLGLTWLVLVVPVVAAGCSRKVGEDEDMPGCLEPAPEGWRCSPPYTGDTTWDDGGDSGEPTGGATETETSTSTATGSSTGGTDSGSDPAQHPRCNEPFPDPPPELPPGINLGPDGTPRFSDWEGLACDDPDVEAVELCMSDGECTSGYCLISNDAYGVCTFADIDIWCDGEGEVIGYGDGECWMCAPVEAHARACCEYGEDGGWDCRAWPFDGSGPPGSVCATHEDCEPGLVCGPHSGEGYGICQCPEVIGSELVPADGCY